LNQNTTGSAATLTTPRSIGGVDFDGSVAIVPTTFGVATFSGDVTVDSTTFHVDSTNNKVGIGTTNPGTALEVFSTSGTQMTLRSDSRYSTIFAVDDTGSSFFGNDRGAIRFTTGGDTSGSGASEKMRILANGNVGIGTVDPQNKLAVAGNVTFGPGAVTTTSAYHAGMLNVIGGGTRALLRIENNSSIGSPGIIFGEGGVFTEDTVPTIKKVQGTNNLAIMTGGNVGIGTDSPASKLTVNQIPEHRASYDHSLAPMTVTNRTVTSNTILNDPKHVLNLAREGTSGEAYGANATFKLSRWENNGLNSRTRLDLNLAHASYDEQHIMTFRSDGNVGIGTTNPGSSLHVNLGNAAGEQHIRATQTSLASSSKAGIRFGDSTWDAFIDHDHGDKDRMNFGFYRNPTREVQMVLTHEGNVGIGTTGPGRKLDVRTGDIRYGDGVADYDIFAAVLDYGGITVNDGGGGTIGYNISTGNSTESWCWRFVDGTAKAPGTDYFRVEYATGNYYHKGTAISDRRTKTNFVSIDGVDALNSITKLNPLVYNDKSSNGEIDNRLKGGFIAQEVLDVIPHLVGYDEDRDKPNENGYATAYALDYNGVFAYNVKATQEIYKLLLIEQTKVTNLEAR
ncbi:MAG: tail fiber domain-containing protein, partial [Flavobacteriales bacterium]